MAIDTRAKRFSMLNFSWVPTVALFEADGTVDADDRAHMLNLYAGITLASPGGEARFGMHMVSIPSYGQSIITGRFS